MSQPDALTAAYTERAHLVAALSKLFPASIETDPAAPDWPVVIVELYTGQVSWHVAPHDLPLFDHLPRDAGRVWDGHDTPTKYQRLDGLHHAHVAMVNWDIPRRTPLPCTKEHCYPQRAVADETPATAEVEPIPSPDPSDEDVHALMAHHERLAAAAWQETQDAPGLAGVLELFAQVIETHRERQKCGVFLGDLAEQLSPAYIRSLIR